MTTNETKRSRVVSETQGTQGDVRRSSSHGSEGMSWGHEPGYPDVDVHLWRGGYVMGTIGTGTDR